MSLRFKLILAVLALGLVGAPSMWGTTITQTCSVTAASIFYDYTCTFNDFNTSLGSLNSATLQLTGVNGSVLPEQTNKGTSTLTFSGSVATIDMVVKGPDGTFIQVMQASNPCAGSVAGGTTNTGCTPTPFSGLSSSVVSASDLSDYEASGNVTLGVAAIGYLYSASGFGGIGPSSGELSFGGAGDIGGTLTLIYDYTPSRVPEPATLLLMGGSLTLFGMMFRKRFPRMPVR